MTAHQHIIWQRMLIMSAVLLSMLLSAVSYAVAADLPGGVTCEQVIRYASDLNIPNTRWGRAQARVIALTFGIYLTNAQLEAAARCIRDNKQ